MCVDYGVTLVQCSNGNILGPTVGAFGHVGGKS